MMKQYLYFLLTIFAVQTASAQDAISDAVSTLTGGFSFSGIVGTLNILMVILLIGGFAFIVIYLLYQNQRFRIIAMVIAKRGEKYEFLRMDRIGIFKDPSGVNFARFRKTREKIQLPDFKGIFRESKKREFVVMIKEGEKAYYQMIIPKKFYTIDGKVALPVIDQNIMRMAMNELTNNIRKTNKAKTNFEKYGTHIAILIVCIILVVGGYILLRKEEQLIGLIGELLNNVKGLQEALVNKAIEGG